MVLTRRQTGETWRALVYLIMELLLQASLPDIPRVAETDQVTAVLLAKSLIM